MKTTIEEYARLKEAILHVRDSRMSFTDYEKTYPERSRQRMRWDYFGVACQLDQALSSLLYQGGNDKTIDTALRKIFGHNA